MQLANRLVRPIIWSALAGLALYGVSVVAGDLRAVWSAVVELGLVGWLAILGLSLVNYGLRFWRWQRYLARLRYRVPHLSSLAYYIAGFAFTATPAKAGEAVRSLYLKRHGVGYVDSLAALFAERLVDIVAMVLLALSAALAFTEARWPVVALMAVVLALIPLVHSNAVHGFIDRRRSRIRSDRLRALGEHFLGLLRSASVLLRSAPLYMGLALGLLAWGAEGIAFYVILVHLDVAVSPVLAVGIYAVSILVGALSFIPGGLGSTEAVMGLLLMALGADLSTAVAATLICRVATLWFAIVIGLGVAVGLETRMRRGVPDQPAPARSESRAG